VLFQPFVRPQKRIHGVHGWVSTHAATVTLDSCSFHPSDECQKNPQMPKTLSFVFDRLWAYLQSWSFPESLKLLQQSWDRAVDGDCELCLNCRWPCKDSLIIFVFWPSKGPYDLRSLMRWSKGCWTRVPWPSIHKNVCVCSGPCLFLSNSFYLFMDTLRVSRESPAPLAEQQSRCATCRCCPNRDPVGKDRNSQCLREITHDHFGVSTCIGALNPQHV